MRLLVDTHVWLWLQIRPERVPSGVLDLLEDGANEVLLSTASVWEIAVKHRRGRLALPDPPSTFVPERLSTSGFRALSIDHAHALRAGSLPLHHHDPFDRMLVAQSQVLGVPLVTGDPALSDYDLEILWS